jgi:hypothetical protein
MFDPKKNIAARLTNAADLLIDFATLGEYGLEPAPKATPKNCEARHRPAAPRRHRIDGPFLLRP